LAHLVAGCGTAAPRLRPPTRIDGSASSPTMPPTTGAWRGPWLVGRPVDPAAARPVSRAVSHAFRLPPLSTNSPKYYSAARISSKTEEGVDESPARRLNAALGAREADWPPWPAGCGPSAKRRIASGLPGFGNDITRHKVPVTHSGTQLDRGPVACQASRRLATRPLLTGISSGVRCRDEDGTPQAVGDGMFVLVSGAARL
jgi:hypothetical protein